MRVEKRTTVDAPIGQVWAFIARPENYESFMEGITSWEVQGEQRTGLGARYATRMKVGSAEIGGMIEIVEFDEPYEIAWTSVLGIDQRGRWRLHERDGGGTNVTLRLGYHTEGGLLGAIAERLAAPIVGTNLRRSLEELRRRVEHSARIVMR
ncbi:MAG: SRPBCC family protein [Solirubrobacterales bacterium]